MLNPLLSLISLDRTRSFIAHPFQVAATAVPLLFATSVEGARPAPSLTSGLAVVRTADSLEIEFRAPAPPGELFIRVHSDRNASVPRFSDRSPLEPEGYPQGTPIDRESWYPVVDFTVDPDMEAVIELSDIPPGANVAWNGWLRRESRPATEALRFPPDLILEWENTLWVDHNRPKITGFYVTKPLSATTGSAPSATIRLLASDWGGRIEVVLRDDTGRESILHTHIAEPSPPEPRPFRPTGAGFEPARLENALAGAIIHTLRSQVTDPNDPTRGGLYVFYDLDAETYRSSHWAWAWGTSAGLLLEARKIPEMTARFDPARLLEAAEAIGDAAIRTTPRETEHPIRDLPISRWDRSPRLDYGHLLAFTPADAAFLAAWSWIRLDEATGHPRWRQANERLINAMDRLMTEFPIPPQNYWPEIAKWDIKVIDESGFGVELFAEQYRVTGDPKMRELGRRYIEQHLEAFNREDGLWDRMHFVDGQEPNRPSVRMTRGLGWPMEGLLAAHRLLPEDGRYLDLAVRMARHLIDAQYPDGYWSHRFDQPPEVWGIGTKGTSLWCWLFYELHKYTGDPEHLATARRALGWLLDQQYFGADPRAFGGHITVSRHSAVGYRAFFQVTCTYGTAFFGLAVLEEMRLQAGGGQKTDQTR